MGEKKKNDAKNSNLTVVLKTDLHCEGCGSKVLKCIRSFDGVESASIEEGQKIRVVGKVDPVKLREKVEQKTHKKVELISPQPKKDKENDNKEDMKKKKESKDKNTNEAKSDDNKSKSKEPAVTTAVFKVHLHCEGCIQKIYKTVSKTKGYEAIKIDKQKEVVTVTGAIDMKALSELLKKTLKKDVEIVPPKKEDDKKKKNNGENKKGKEEKEEGFVDKKEEAYPGFVGEQQQFHYTPYPLAPYHAPQIFSDENPNACAVM